MHLFYGCIVAVDFQFTSLLWLHCRIFSVLSAILYLGNVTYRRKSTGRDEGLDVGPPEVLATLSDLLKVTDVFVFMCLHAS